MPSRRTLLAGLGSGTVAGLAGCLSFDTDSEPTPDQWLEKLYITNRDTRAWNIDVAVLRAGEVVSWESHAIEKRDDGVVAGARVTIPEFTKKTADWTIIAHLQGTDVSTTLDVGTVVSDDPAITIELRITPDADIDTHTVHSGG